MRYAIVTPLRDEAANLERIAACMAAQTVLPDRWVLVENGSSDATPEIATRLAAQHPWIWVVRGEPAAAAERGAPIVHAIHQGVALLDPRPEAVGQLDADLTLPPDYFDRLLHELETSERLGIVSGTCFEQHDGDWLERFATAGSVWGAARLYRRACLDEVLPLEPRTGWDAIDAAQANASGWQTRILRDLPFYHHRREAERETTRWSAWAAQGRVSYYLGYRPSYLFIRALFRALRDPSSLGLLVGYAGDALRQRPRCAREGVRTWVRQQQRLRNLAHRAAEARGCAHDSSALRGPRRELHHGGPQSGEDEEDKSDLNERQGVEREHPDTERRYGRDESSE
jgi:glycosyltransferase involved in cell wall biosynthesis